MAGFTSLMLTAAMVAASTPAAAADPMGDLLKQIQRDQDRKQFKHAADLAAPASRRTDLRAADRFLLAGLAAESYRDAFQYGGAPRQPRRDPAYLCAQRAVLQEAIALTDDTGKHSAVNDDLGKVAAQLAQVAASGRDVPCELAPVGGEVGPMPPVESPPAESPPAESPPVEAPSSERAAGAKDAPRFTTGPAPATSRVDQRRVRAGVGTLVPGLLLFAPVAAVLVHRGQGERELWALQEETADRKATDAETSRAAALHQRFQVTTATAAVLGATGAALAVTGIFLLATGERRSRVAVAPWGARNSGGLVLEGRF